MRATINRHRSYLISKDRNSSLEIALQPEWCTFGAVVGIAEAAVLNQARAHDQAPWLKARVLLVLDGKIVAGSPTLWLQGHMWPLKIPISLGSKMLKVVVQKGEGTHGRQPAVDMVYAGFNTC